MDIQWLHELQALEILGPMATPTLEEFQQGRRREPGVLPDRGPHERPKGEQVGVEQEHVHEVARLIPARQRQRLVDRQIDGVKGEPAELVPDRREKPPGGIMRPIDASGFPVLADDRTDESRLADFEFNVIPRLAKGGLIVVKGGGDPLHRVVEEIEIFAEARRVRGEMERRAPGQVTVRRPMAGHLGQDMTLEVG